MQGICFHFYLPQLQSAELATAFWELGSLSQSTMAKFYDKRTLNHQQALMWVGQKVFELRNVFNTQQTEAGIDGIIDLADPQTGAATGAFLGVQVKTNVSVVKVNGTDRVTTGQPDAAVFPGKASVSTASGGCRQSSGAAL